MSELNLTPLRDTLRAQSSLIGWLLQIIVALLEEVQALRAKLAAAAKDSTTSHKPPSSDGFKKKRGAIKRGSSGRKPGGQKGHRGITRRNVPSSEVTATIPHKPDACENCGASFTEQHPSVPVERRQVWEIPEIKPLVNEHVFYQTTCDCGHPTRLPVPEWIYCGMGDNLQAHLAYFTAEAKLSRRTLQTVLDDVFHVPQALGTIQNRLEDTSEIIKPVCDELENELTKQPVVNIDETSYPHNKKLAWLWAFVTSTFAFFTIQTSRGAQVLRKVLGELYDGIIICDRFSAYVKYHKDRACGLIQLCWAHLIRDLKALQNELAVESDQIFAVVMRKRIGAVFRLWYAHKQEKISRPQLIAAAEPLIAEMRAFVENNQRHPTREVAKFNRQLLKRWDSLFTFIYHEGVEPTNNLAERLIRPGVQTRKISYCTRSENGQLLRARLLTVSQTCRIQQRNALEFYRTAISAHRNNLTMPSLLTNPNNQHLRMAA
jgi:transposase